ncbi:MAG TPA: hypothetical protein VKX17_06955 [Planctomycetota bacterium]|nr:hypothetical protein [Planctomycetota bacterium]
MFKKILIFSFFLIFDSIAADKREQDLTKKLESLCAQDINFVDLEKIIGERPKINTVNAEEKAAFKVMRYKIESGIDLKEQQEVAFWFTAEPKQGFVAIVGIAKMINGKQIVFRGAILGP